MSYILDALRRADAERERGAVPSLQSQQHTIAEDDAAVARPRSLLWAVIALALALVALLAWNFLGGAPAPARTPIEGSITTPVPAPPPALQPAPAPPTAALLPSATVPAVTAPAAAPAPHALQAPPSPAEARVTSPEHGPQPTAPPPTVATAPPSARSPTDARKASPSPAAKRVGATTGAAPDPAPAAEPRVHAQSELPEEIRRDLPKIVVGGSSYSGDAASRMVMINGQVFHEGDRLAPDLVLERIRLKSAVLSFKGWRYEVLF